MKEIYATPEEAALAGLPRVPKTARVVGVVIRGDQAVVAQELDDDPSDIETSHVSRVTGGWKPSWEGSGNGTFIFTGKHEETIAVVLWGDAPKDAVAARFTLLGREQIFDLKDGRFFVVFDEIPFDDFWPHDKEFFDCEWPQHKEWIFDRA